MVDSRLPKCFVALAIGALVAGCVGGLERRFLDHIEYLAGDELQGRGVGTPGIDAAAEYIAGQFEMIGLEPAGDSDTYYQTFPITLSPSLTPSGRLTFSGDTLQRQQGVDFVPFNFSAENEFSGGVVFCGYGIINAQKGYDDFKDVDLSGQAAVMFAGEPPSWADGEGNPTTHALHRNKVYNAKDRGAVAVLIVNPKPEAGESDRLPEFAAEGADAYGIPVLHVTRALVDAVVRRGGLAPLDDLQKKLDEGEYASGVAAHVSVSGQAGLKRATASARNVLGILRGRGPRTDEVVVVGAHYDHLGVRRPMMRKFKAGRLVADEVAPQIHNGADDNASGTSALIEIARMFAGSLPQRSVLFIAFSAEESGLHGSKHYVEHPTVPLEKTVAMLNMDMIGRLKRGQDDVTVFGVACGKSFAEVLDAADDVAGLTVVAAVDEGGRSDHASFLRKDIPSLHFFSGNHADYHQPGDDTHKINVPGGARITRLVYETARELAARDARPEFVVVKQEKKDPAAKTTTFRVVMGLTPNYAEDGKPGMVVDAVSAEGPAQLAGMKAGDRILIINGKTIANVYDYMASTRGNKAGDTVEVLVSRDGKEVPLKVTLAGAR
jgi:hypothetical protein